MILIISHKEDSHTEKVTEVLARRGHPAEVLDLSRFPAEASLAISYEPDQYGSTRLHWPGKTFAMEDCRAIWWRRPQGFKLHEEVKGPVESSFAFTECQCAVSGMWLLEPARWINHPVTDEVANRKVYQLKVATNCGLTIPRTLITNDPAKARGFIRPLGIGNVIYKSFAATLNAWRETRLVKEEELDKLDAVKYAPVIFQECIHADIDLRITIIGDRVFPAAIYSQETSYKVDYRMNYTEARIVQHELPAELVAKLQKLMKALGLVYGAVDMRRNARGEYIFLEINTAGQWLFMEEPTGMPITEALVDKLIELDTVASADESQEAYLYQPAQRAACPAI